MEYGMEWSEASFRKRMMWDVVACLVGYSQFLSWAAFSNFIKMGGPIFKSHKILNPSIRRLFLLTFEWKARQL